MKTYVGLLRGINVAGRNSLPMGELRQILGGLGCADVQTYIQSGNVVLRSAANPTRLSAAVSAGIMERRGFEPRVLLLSKSDFLRAVRNNPFPQAESEPKAVHVGFMDAVPTKPDLRGIEELRAPSERFELIGAACYLYAPEGVGRSKLAVKGEKLLGVAVTDRNWNTVCRILSLLEAMPG